MTPLPKRKLSRGRQGRRRHSISIKIEAISACPNCKQPVKSHTVCPNCGMYKGKEIIKPHLPKNKNKK